jgi:hypothetical protein
VTASPRECTALHTRLLKCTLEAENARAYWRRMHSAGGPVTARRVQEEFWFGARSAGRVVILLANFRARFDAFPPALEALALWHAMEPQTRRVICHWHLQLSDPLYRRFTGEFLLERRQRRPAEVSLTPVLQWVGELSASRWGPATRIQFASKLLSSAMAAGLIASRRDPRPLTLPPIDDLALGYLLYLLKGTRFEGSLLANPYLHSVGLVGPDLERRLKTIPGLRFRRQGDLVDFGWQYSGLGAWSRAVLERPPAAAHMEVLA